MSLFHRKAKRPASEPLLRPSTVAATVELELLADEVVKIAQEIKRTVATLRANDPSLPGRREGDPQVLVDDHTTTGGAD